MNLYQTVKDMPQWMRPYEKCEAFGAKALSDAELLAVLLSSGSRGQPSTLLASELLKEHGGREGLLGLYHLSHEQLLKIKGIGKVKALRLQCMLELSVRISRKKAQEKLSFHNPETIAAYYMEDMRHLEAEEVKAVLLDGKNGFIRDISLSNGTVNVSLVSARELFKQAVRYDAVYIILLHNHPSGDVTPSAQDKDVTKRIKEAGELMEIKLIDHIIIGNNNYVSFRQAGLL